MDKEKELLRRYWNEPKVEISREEYGLFKVEISSEEYGLFVDAKVFLKDVLHLGLNEEQIKDYARKILARHVINKL